jgi:hypothetical protein
MDLNNRFCIFDRNIISDLFGDEVVLVNLESGIYYSLRGSSAQIWIRIQNNYSIHELIEELSVLYQTKSERLSEEVINFIKNLISQNLIKIADTSEKTQIPLNPNSPKLDFSSPNLEVFSDMQEILLLDPVHDVNKEGWPIRKDSNKEE